MKQIIFIAAISMAASSVSAQSRVIYDHHDEASRVVSTGKVTFASYKKGFSWDMSLAYVEKYSQFDTLSYYAVGFWLTTKTPIDVPADSRMLIRFENDSVVETSMATPLTPSSFTFRTSYGVSTYSFCPEYILDTELMNYIATHKIVKIRLEAPWSMTGLFDYYIDPRSKIWTPSETITALRQVIDTHLKGKPSNTLYDDF